MLLPGKSLGLRKHFRLAAYSHVGIRLKSPEHSTSLGDTTTRQLRKVIGLVVGRQTTIEMA
jgi:hypothetical protein